MTVSGEKGVLHGLADLIGLGLPCTQTDGGDLVAGVEGVSLPIEIMVSDRPEWYSKRNLLSVLVRHFGE